MASFKELYKDGDDNVSYDSTSFDSTDIALASGKMMVGQSTGLAAAVTPSGDVAVSTAGAMTVTDLTIASEVRGDFLRRGSSTWERASGKDSGKILLGDGTDIISATVSGDATISAAGALTVVDLTLGSDAAGDTFYKTSATVTARLPKGTAFQVMRMNSGATAPEWGLLGVSALVGSEARTATSDGLTTGAITTPTAFRTFITVTSAAASDAITLPVISAGTIGQEIFLTVTSNGYELLTPAASNNTINQVDSDGTNQLDVAATTTVRCTQISATAWLAETIAAATIAITAPDND